MTATPSSTAGEVSPDPAATGPSEPEAIFVVGVSRSGTTLLRRVLETSDRVAIAGENHFVGHLIEREGARHYFRKLGDLEEDETIRRLVEMVYSGEFQRRSRFRELSPYWRWLIKHIDQNEFERRLLAGERSERGLMRELMRTYADFRGRPLMGEKTPAHLGYVETLLDWFPGGRVVHILRDPRAIYVSELRRRRSHRRRPYSWLMKVPLLFEAVMLVQTTVVWAGAARRHRQLERLYPGRYMLVRFEDMVQHPDAHLPRLFDFVGVEMPAGATDVSVVSRGFRLGEAGLDAGAATRWREQIHPFAARWLRTFLGASMRRLEYPT
jgi:hypothetical protein